MCARLPVQLCQAPAQSRPARPPWPFPRVPSASHRVQAEWVRARGTGPRRSGQASKSRPARRRPQPRPSPSKGCFSHPDTFPINTQSPLWSLPKQTPQQSQGPGQDGTASAGRPPSPASAESRDPVISGGPRMCSILGPEGSDVTRCPSSGIQVLPGPQELPRERSVDLLCCYCAPHPSPGKRATSSQESGV